MTFDEPFIDEEGNVVVIVRDENGNIIGKNVTVQDCDA